MVQSSDDARDTSASVGKALPQFELYNLSNTAEKDKDTYSSLSEKIYSETEPELSSALRIGADSLPFDMTPAADLLDFDTEGTAVGSEPGTAEFTGTADGSKRDTRDTKTEATADGDYENDEFFSPEEEGDGQPEMKGKTDREKLQEALEKRNAPYRQEIDDIKRTIEKADGFKKVWSQVSIDHGMTSLDIKDDKGTSMRLSNSGHGDIYVVQKGGDTYVINRNEPLLDTKVGASDPKGGKIDWSLDRPLRKQAIQQYQHSTLTLNQQASENRRPDKREIGLQQVAGAQNIAEQAHNQGLISDKEYASQTGFSGFLTVLTSATMEPRHD